MIKSSNKKRFLKNINILKIQGNSKYCKQHGDSNCEDCYILAEKTPCGFSKIVSSKQRVKPWFFETFKIIIRHILLENFLEIPQVVQKLWRISLSILAIFINFYQFFGYFDISL